MRALVLSGGGSRGAFQVGVISKLVENGASWDLIAGVSVGAINGAFMAQYAPRHQWAGAKMLRKLWKDEIKGNKSIYKNWWCGRAGGLVYGGLYNTQPLRELIKKNFDQEKVRSSGVKLRIGAVGYETGRYKYITEETEDIPSWIMASSAFPVAFPPVKIGDETWMDGGVRDVTPIRDVLTELSVNSSVDTIDIILTGQVSNDVGLKPSKEASNALNVAIRSATLMSNEVFLGDLENLEATHRKINLYTPPMTYKLQDPLTFDPEEIYRAIDVGEYEAAEFPLFR